MKKNYAIILFVCCIFLARSQDEEGMKTNLVDFNALISVPDNPAFKALDFDASKAIKPSDVKAFAISFDPFNFNDDNFNIPINIGIEVAPYRLLNEFKLSQYNKGGNVNINKIMYHSALSMATSYNMNEEQTQLSLGYRLSIPLASDPFMDPDILNLVDQYGEVKIMWESFLGEKYFELYVNENKAYNDAEEADFIKDNFDNTTYWKEFVKTNENYKGLKVDYVQGKKTYVKNYLEKNWNRPMLDVAVAWIGDSKDSTINDLHINSWSVWATYTGRLPEKMNWMHAHSLLLIGLNYQWFPGYDNINKNQEFAFYTRAYLGSNKVRGYLEYQHLNTTYEQILNNQIDKSLNTKSGSISLGGEFYLGKNIWLNFSGGVDDFYGTQEESEFISNLELKYGLQNLFQNN